jgi:hypothetical protein
MTSIGHLREKSSHLVSEDHIDAMATSATIAEMKKMTMIFYVNMSSAFDEVNNNFMKLNACLANIKCQRSPKACEAVAKDLEV